MARLRLWRRNPCNGSWWRKKHSVDIVAVASCQSCPAATTNDDATTTSISPGFIFTSFPHFPKIISTITHTWTWLGCWLCDCESRNWGWSDKVCSGTGVVPFLCCYLSDLIHVMPETGQISTVEAGCWLVLVPRPLRYWCHDKQARCGWTNSQSVGISMVEFPCPVSPFGAGVLPAKAT